MPETIEAEVIEIDGVLPPRVSEKTEKPESGSSSARFQTGMRGTILNLDRRWWPLWLLLGVIGVVLAASVGVVLGVSYLIFTLIRAFLRGLLGGISGGGAASGSLRKG